MGLFSEVRRSITRLWGRTEQAVGEAYGNEALEYEGEADAAKADAEAAADGTDRSDGSQHGHRTHDRGSNGPDGAADPGDDGTAGVPAR